MEKIDQILSSKGFKKTAQVAFVCIKAEKIIQDYFKNKRIKVLKYQGKRLFLKTGSSATSQQIFQNKEELAELIKKELKIEIKDFSYQR